MVEQVADSGGKVYYFDAGASTYTAGAGGASQNWFVGIFHFPVLYFVILNREEWIEKKGLNLAGIFAWELAALAPSDVSSNEKTRTDLFQVWKQIPGRLFPIYHWYNIPVATEKDSHLNPFTILKQVVKPEDLVVSS